MKETMFGTVSLGGLIEALKKLDPHQVVQLGISHPDSYRGYYDHVAFYPQDETTVDEMLKSAQSALGETFQGYKGGDFTMRADTPVWIATNGNCGWPLTPALLALMLKR